MSVPFVINIEKRAPRRSEHGLSELPFYGTEQVHSVVQSRAHKCLTLQNSLLSLHNKVIIIHLIDCSHFVSDFVIAWVLTFSAWAVGGLLCRLLDFGLNYQDKADGGET